VPMPALSQVAGLVILPVGAPLPTSWTNANAWGNVLDNAATDDLTGRYFICTGEITEPVDINVRLGRGHLQTARRRYELTAFPSFFDDTGYAFLRNLQRSNRGFRLWVATLGGRLLGGATGLKPHFITAKMIYPGGVEDREQAKVAIQWYADTDADRASVPALFGTGTAGSNVLYGSGGGSGGGGVVPYQQEFTSLSGTSVTITENGGVLPEDSAIMVFFNGQLYTGWTKLGSSINMGFTLDPLHVVNVVFFA
jgi:hypothetical protein